MRSKADRRPDNAIPRNTHRREVARRPRPRLTIAERRRRAAAAQAKADEREAAGFDRCPSVDDASLSWWSRDSLSIGGLDATIACPVRPLARSRRRSHLLRFYNGK
jgi:hypothetical protein